jgi:hypothetical protein
MTLQPLKFIPCIQIAKWLRQGAIHGSTQQPRAAEQSTHAAAANTHQQGSALEHDSSERHVGQERAGDVFRATEIQVLDHAALHNSLGVLGFEAGCR